MNHRMNKHWKKTENFVHGIREHGLCSMKKDRESEPK
uniref:Uncharacterized protein n=1 Tax=Vitis vinifera TaxID=29760 RepID=F6HW12_VITVI